MSTVLVYVRDGAPSDVSVRPCLGRRVVHWVRNMVPVCRGSANSMYSMDVWLFWPVEVYSRGFGLWKLLVRSTNCTSRIWARGWGYVLGWRQGCARTVFSVPSRQYRNRWLCGTSERQNKLTASSTENQCHGSQSGWRLWRMLVHER